MNKLLPRSLFLASLVVVNAALADFSLDPESSSLSVVSYKVLAEASGSVGESHSFSGLTGSVTDSGEASVTVPLDRLETNIPIRNERIAEFLFETDQYPEATVTTTVPADVLKGGNAQLDLDITVALHGQEQALSVPVFVANEDGRITVTSTQPILLDATAFELGSGISKLTELAKLLYIPTTVPVSFSLAFASVQ